MRTKGLAFVLAVGFLSPVLASEIRVDGGKLSLSGKLQTSILTIDSGAVLEGTGIVEGMGDISGIVAPGEGATGVGAITFTGNLNLRNGSVFECYAATHTALDILVSGGTVSGDCAVNLTRATNAIPLHQVIVNGDASSDYTQFAATTPTAWRLAPVAEGDLEVTELTGDSDHNTLPDWWEFDFFGQRTGTDPYADGDEDLMLNWQERIAGTDPTNASSRLMAQVVENHSTTDLVISWESVEGKMYSLLLQTNLATDSSTTVASDIPATPPVNTFTNVVQDWENLYYRVEVQQ